LYIFISPGFTWRWAEAMASQGSGGAYEISQRMTALVGWGATSGLAEDWVYDGTHERYVEDEAGGCVENNHSTDAESPPPPPRVCTSIHTRGKLCSDLGRVRVLTDPAAG
jgi:hypothetical protein